MPRCSRRHVDGGLAVEAMVLDQVGGRAAADESAIDPACRRRRRIAVRPGMQRKPGRHADDGDRTGHEPAPDQERDRQADGADKCTLLERTGGHDVILSD